MDETKVQIGEDVLLDIGTHSDWYISAVSYDGESVNVDLRRKAARHKEWWLADTPQTDCNGCKIVGWYDTDFPCVNCSRKTKDYYSPEQTDCAWR